MPAEYYRIDVLTESGELVRGEECATLEDLRKWLAIKRAERPKVEFRPMHIKEEPLYL